MRIQQLRLKGFKRFDDLTIDLGANPARVVALVGPNGCGKSSVFDAFEQLLKQVKSVQGVPESFLSKHLFHRDPEMRKQLFSLTRGSLAGKAMCKICTLPPRIKPVAFYSLDLIMSVGYRVKSQRGTQFRIWATRTLRDHLLREYTLTERHCGPLPRPPNERSEDRASLLRVRGIPWCTGAPLSSFIVAYGSADASGRWQSDYPCSPLRRWSPNVR